MNKVGDIEILNYMLDKLNSYEKDEIELSFLISMLEEALHSIKIINEEWGEKFLDEFSVLESINAKKLEDENLQAKLLNESVFNLKMLINNKISNI